MEIAKDRKHDILMAALEAFTKKGYDKTSIDDIVRVSGLSKGTLYWYFENKQALFSSVIQMVLEQFMQVFDTLIHQAQDRSPVDALRLMFTGTADFIETDPRFSALTTDFFLQAWHHAEVQTVFSRMYVNYINSVAGIIQRGIDRGDFKLVDPQVVASAIAGSLDGIALQKLFEKEISQSRSWNLRSVFEAAGELIITGLLKGDRDAR